MPCILEQNIIEMALLLRICPNPAKVSGSGGIFARAGFGKNAGFRPEPESGTALKQTKTKNKRKTLIFPALAADRHQTWHVDRACPYHFWVLLGFLCPTSSFEARGLQKFGGKMTHCSFVPTNLSFMNQTAPNFNMLRRQLKRI